MSASSEHGVRVAEAALDYLDLGLSILPLRPWDKTPSTPRGFRDSISLKADVPGGPASVRDHVRRYFLDSEHSDENIGIVTGELYDVLDVDVKGDKKGRESVLALHAEGLLDGFVGVALTPSGGIHYFYPSRKSRTELLGEGLGLDYKSVGGYVVAAPSRINSMVVDEVGDTGMVVQHYRWVTPLMEPWRGKALDWDRCKKVLRVKPKSGVVSEAWGKHWPETTADDTLIHMCAYLLRNPEDRNRNLFWAACKCAMAGVTDKASWEQLADASLAMSVGGENRESEVWATINSAIRTVQEAEMEAGMTSVDF